MTVRRSASGPPPDPRSARSERRGVVSVTTAVLSTTGYRGRIPGLNRFLPHPTPRHREIWAELWRHPQAAIWITQRWRWPVVAELVRLMVLTEQDDCRVGVFSAIRQRRDDLGLSTHGQRVEGWEVASGVTVSNSPRPAAGDEVGQRRQRRSQTLHEER